MYVINPKGLYVIKPPREHTSAHALDYIHGWRRDYIQRVNALITYQPAKAAWIEKTSLTRGFFVGMKYILDRANERVRVADIDIHPI